MVAFDVGAAWASLFNKARVVQVQIVVTETTNRIARRPISAKSGQVFREILVLLVYGDARALLLARSCHRRSVLIFPSAYSRCTLITGTSEAPGGRRVDCRLSECAFRLSLFLLVKELSKYRIFQDSSSNLHQKVREIELVGLECSFPAPVYATLIDLLASVQRLLDTIKYIGHLKALLSCTRRFDLLLSLAVPASPLHPSPRILPTPSLQLSQVPIE